MSAVAVFEKKSPTFWSGGNVSAGLDVSPSRSRTVSLYSDWVSLRSGATPPKSSGRRPASALPASGRRPVTRPGGAAVADHADARSDSETARRVRGTRPRLVGSRPCLGLIANAPPVEARFVIKLYVLPGG